jgi:dynein heavy chain
MVKIHERFSKKGWELDKTTIFAQIDAFIQRCKDLIDVILLRLKNNENLT